MAGVDPVSQGLFFAASQSVTAQAAANTKQKEKTSSTKRGSFANAIKKSEEEKVLQDEGLPPEIAGMDLDDAVVFLKDAADIAADKLKSDMSPVNFATYRKSITQFMKYVVKNAYEIEKRKRPGLNRKGKPFDPQTQVILVNTKLNEMADWLIHDHHDTLKMLAKVEEIKGMLVDLIAR
jgi:Uncharacterized protein conserved in bacteria